MKKFKEMVYRKENLDKPEILFDEEYYWFRIIGMSLGTHPVAYVGLPENHILAGFNYFDLGIIDVYGGLTFSGKGDGNYLPEGYWWYGWDYAHSGDWMGYYDENDGWVGSYKKWTTRQIYEDAKDVVKQLINLEEFAKAMLKKFVKDAIKIYDINE